MEEGKVRIDTSDPPGRDEPVRVMVISGIWISGARQATGSGRAEERICTGSGCVP
jgi:hypothetical protein